jgi:hypothetical protein
MRRPQPQPRDPSQHAQAIQSLTVELNLPPEKVEFAYGIVLRRIEKEAVVTDFLTVFVRRGARECLLCAERKAQCATRDDCLLALENSPRAGRAGPTGAA